MKINMVNKHNTTELEKEIKKGNIIMNEERLLARGKFEESKDKLSNIHIQIRTLLKDIHRKTPIIDITRNLITDIADIDIKGAKVLLERLEELLEKQEFLNAELKTLSDKWKFKLNY